MFQTQLFDKEEATGFCNLHLIKSLQVLPAPAGFRDLSRLLPGILSGCSPEPGEPSECFPAALRGPSIIRSLFRLTAGALQGHGSLGFRWEKRVAIFLCFFGLLSLCCSLVPRRPRPGAPADPVRARRVQTLCSCRPEPDIRIS